MIQLARLSEPNDYTNGQNGWEAAIIGRTRQAARSHARAGYLLQNAGSMSDVFVPSEVIATERLLLRRPRVEDVQAVFDGYAQDPEVVRFLVWRGHASVADTREFLESCSAKWDERSAFPWSIVRSSGDAVMGMIELRPRGHEASLGWVLMRSAWNQGYMTEAARALIDVAFSDPAVFRVWAVCDVENLASARVMADGRV